MIHKFSTIGGSLGTQNGIVLKLVVSIIKHLFMWGKTANCKLKKKVVFISRMQATSLSVMKENEFGNSLGATKDFILTPLSNMNCITYFFELRSTKPHDFTRFIACWHQWTFFFYTRAWYILLKVFLLVVLYPLCIMLHQWTFKNIHPYCFMHQ